MAHVKNLTYSEKYHDNCHDYLKSTYLEKYADPKYKSLLYDIKNKIPKINICEDTAIDEYSNIITCDQHAVIFGDKNDIFPILATYSLNACIGLVMYIPSHGIGSIAHIDGLPGYSKKSAKNDGFNINFSPISENINNILNYLRNLSGTNEILEINYYLFGGIYGLSEVMIHDIIESINEIESKSLIYKFNFAGRNLLGPDNQSRNICIDMRSGIISYFDYIMNDEYYHNVRNDNGLAMNIIKAPRKSEALLDVTYDSIFDLIKT
ncbi:putative chemotaxis protein ched [Cotonvirus japonicus]|uniref:Chemotaxis protein ched n=1 Tax=Cotonvirus japonicus TaxID=2811091 RepID=A0ABM7NRX7_9VIRU|nr:putative chemotaxis protein ched [Cotonvirus japonicus]BCS82915.1 putative chemotaxis protein ched [Cotonvirus japonicus]